MEIYTLKVPENYLEKTRLDLFVAENCPKMNRSKLKAGALKILVNGKKSKLSQKIKAKDNIYIEWEDNIPENIEPENIPLKIIYEDENVTIINKRQGMVTHPANGNWNKTLVNALLFHWGRDSVENKNNESETDYQIIANRRPGIVHRLDKDTSGVIITAKNRETEEYLCKCFKERKLQKEYILIAQGRPKKISGEIKTQIKRDPKNRKRFIAETNTNEGKYSHTIYHCIACYGPYSLIRVRIKTGRTHQIRVHMKYLGCPILGDEIYGKKDSLFEKATLMLHSRQIILKLPGEIKNRRFKARIPLRFKNTLKILKEKYPKEIFSNEKK